MYVCMYGHHIWEEKDQPGEVANPAHGPAEQGKLMKSRLRLRIWSRETGSSEVTFNVSLLISIILRG